jgi:peptide/nickel transport system substrate-binding protein
MRYSFSMPPVSGDTDTLPINDDSSVEDGSRIVSTLTKERGLGLFATLHDLQRRFRPAERLALYVLIMVMTLSALALLYGVNTVLSVEVPVDGGGIVEGEVGSARFINPVIALSRPDQDLTALVYSGLMRAAPDGSFVPDLAESYSVSDDGTVYTFAIRRNATFHDGKPVTADDVAYTIRMTQDPTVKSPHRADWDSVKVETPDVRTVVFTLPHAYAPFLANTTLGILPQHLWATVSGADFPFATLNTRPVGSGPFKVDSFETDQTGASVRYDLVPFNDFTLGRPHLRRLTFKFYANEDMLKNAYADKAIDAVAGLPPSKLEGLARADATVRAVPLPRSFAVFFNQAHAAVLADASVRAALDAAVDKQLVIDMVLRGQGVVLDSPVPPGIVQPALTRVSSLSSALASTTRTSNPEAAAAARAILSKGGWTFSEQAGTWTKDGKVLVFSLATADAPELIATAGALAAQWRAVGIQAVTAVYPLADLNTNVIRPRNYDALLFGEIVGREADLFAFWHSSQRMDPGLNLSLYANTKTDALLSQARMETDRTARGSLYAEFAAILVDDKPAVFLYAPDFLYVVPEDIRGMALGTMTTPAERFFGAYRWYTQTERVWSIFAAEQGGF